VNVGFLLSTNVYSGTNQVAWVVNEIACTLRDTVPQLLSIQLSWEVFGRKPERGELKVGLQMIVHVKPLRG
jgi:hypothetical protein